MKTKEIYQEEFVGSLMAANAKHFLKIHHDYNMSEKGGSLIGHFYVELYDSTTNTGLLRGKNPQEKSFELLNVGEIKNELGRITKTKDYMDEMDDIILTTKVIPLTEEQYSNLS